jgi:hypothetical protein
MDLMKRPCMRFRFRSDFRSMLRAWGVTEDGLHFGLEYIAFLYSIDTMFCTCHSLMPTLFAPGPCQRPGMLLDAIAWRCVASDLTSKLAMAVCNCTSRFVSLTPFWRLAQHCMYDKLLSSTPSPSHLPPRRTVKCRGGEKCRYTGRLHLGITMRPRRRFVSVNGPFGSCP